MDGVDVASHELLSPLPLLGHESGPFEHGDVLLHGGEAHRVALRQRGHGVLPSTARATMSRRVPSARAWKMRSTSVAGS